MAAPWPLMAAAAAAPRRWMRASAHHGGGRKADLDAKRTVVFTKLAAEIYLAAKGNDPARLEHAMTRAKKLGFPRKGIESAIERAAGGGDGSELVTYEAFGPGGVALLVNGLTNNRSRTVANVKAALNKHGGSLVGEGAVIFMFSAPSTVLRLPSPTRP